MLTVDIQSEPDSLVVDAIIKSDTPDIKFQEKVETDDFRIDIADKLFALANADIIKNDLAALEDPDLSEEEKLSINNGIADMETRIGTPIISIDKNNFSTYFNIDNDSLLQNGVQIQILADDTMLIRFAPIQNFTHYGEDNISITILFCVIGFDFDKPLGITDRKAFDVCVLPRLTTSVVEKSNPASIDPILPDDAERPDYPFNDPYEDNVDNLYVNNGANAVEEQKTPVHIVKTSAISTDEITSYTDNEKDFNWQSFESVLIDDKESFINLPFDINGHDDIDDIEQAPAVTANIINDPNITETVRNTLTGVRIYEIKQYVVTSGDEAYVSNNARVSVDV